MESNLQNKLQQFSAAPPEAAWQKIVDALDKEETFPQRLYQYEEQPPFSAWTEIEKEMERNQEAPAKVVPFTTRFKTVIRYAAVACFIAVVLVTVTLIVKRTEAGALQQESRTTIPTKETAVATDNTTAQQPSLSQVIKDEESSQAIATAKNDKSLKSSDNSAAAFNKNNRTPVITASILPTSKNYVTFSDGDGNVRKVSKKMASFVKCADGDAACKQRLQKLRQKMASAVITTDFTGVLDLLRQLQ